MARRGETGFTYLWLLFAVAGLGLLLAAAAQSWDTAARREREAELLFVGGEFARALRSYHERSPGVQKQFPLRLEDLVEDRRFPEPQRHLRKLYRDPMMRGADWGLVKSGGRIVAVHSQSEGRPLRTHFSDRLAAFAGAQRYSEWVFGPEQAGGTAEDAPRSTAHADAAEADATDTPDTPVDSCRAALLVELRQCALATAGRPVEQQQHCNVAAVARHAACRHGG